MKKLRSILVLFLLCSTMFMFNEKVDASAWRRLETESLTTCNGVLYGKHEDHWHRAVKGGWYYYPAGPPVSKPCGKIIGREKSNSSSNYHAEHSAEKAVANNKVAGDKKSAKNEANSEDINPLKEQENNPSKKASFADSDEKNKEQGSNNIGILTGVVVGIIGGAGGSYLIRRHHTQQKKDDLSDF